MRLVGLTVYVYNSKQTFGICRSRNITFLSCHEGISYCSNRKLGSSTLIVVLFLFLSTKKKEDTLGLEGESCRKNYLKNGVHVAHASFSDFFSHEYWVLWTERTAVFSKHVSNLLKSRSDEKFVKNCLLYRTNFQKTKLFALTHIRVQSITIVIFFFFLW